MSRMWRVVLAVAIVISIVNIIMVKAYAGSFGKDKRGTTGAQFLKIGCGARALGMGEAYSAVADESSAIYWNPAGLGQIKQSEVSAMHAIWLEDINYDYLVYAQPMLGGGMGIGLNYLSMTKIEKLDVNGDSEGTFKPYDGAVNIAYAHNIVGSVKAGVNVKYIKEQLDDEQASAYAADIGLLSPLVSEDLKVAFVGQNIGSKIKFIKEEYDLPLTMRLGVSYNGFKSLTLALDGVAPVDNDPNVHIGCEYRLPDSMSIPLALRVGYKTTTISDLDAMSGLSGGIGFKVGVLSIDYAWVPYGDIGDTHRISLGMKFGDVKDSKVVKVSSKNAVSDKTVKNASVTYKSAALAPASSSMGKKLIIRKKVLRVK